VLLIILGIFWVAILVPVAVKRFRDNGTEKSIHSFHVEHELLSRQEYAVAPAHRLDAPDQEETARSLAQRPRLTVVHADDTYRSLEARNSWDEWASDYDYEREDETPRPIEPTNRYVSAYSSVPNEMDVSYSRAVSRQQSSMKARRQMVFLSIVAAAVVFSGVGFVMGYSLVEDLAVLGWVAVLCYVALALFAVSQGYLYESSLPIRIPEGRRLATVEPLYVDEYGDDDEEFYDAEGDDDWRRDAHTHYAVG
jgi:hypothetical protein